MSDELKVAAQAVLDRWNSPKWEWDKQGPTADLMADLRAALSTQPAPIAQPVQPAKPLTLAQIDLEVWNAHIAYALDKFSSFEVALTRKVEAAHGITVPAPRNDAATGQIKKEGES